ncbi:MAG TPA: NADH-quinone oxidoreductase subunit H [bacterium]|jgi:formate hydrogenlyase subunit 4
MPASLIWVLHIILIPALSPFYVGLTRKIKARLQNRTGASCFQPYRDLQKLFAKDEVISEDASWLFRAAPYLIFAVTLIVGASIPLLSTALTNPLTGDFLVVVYLLALGTFFLALAGMDTGSGFGGFGSSREMLVAALSEAGLVLSLLTLALISHSTNLTTIAATITALPFPAFAPILLAFVGFAIALLAETCRYPFDNPATHLELTMIHEAMLIEYSGKRLALMEWASANKYLLFIALGANLFFPWGIAHTLEAGPLLLGLFSLLLKAAVFSTAIAVIESSIAKYRIMRLPDLLFTSFIVSIIALGLTL